MSNYSEITRHPLTGVYHVAEWTDDYFGPHRYGVRFPDDPVVYPAEQVAQKQLKEFWVADVLETLRATKVLNDEQIVAFFNDLNRSYKARWKRDPVGGEGAVDYYRGKYTHAGLKHMDDLRDVTADDKEESDV